MGSNLSSQNSLRLEQVGRRVLLTKLFQDEFARRAELAARQNKQVAEDSAAHSAKETTSNKQHRTKMK